MFGLNIKGLMIATLCWGIFLLHPQQASAQETSDLPAAFVEIGVGAGPMGMGGAAIVIGRDIYTIVNNPAGLISVSDPEAAFSMTKQFGLIPYNLILVGKKIDLKSSFGIGLLTSGDEALRENTLYMSYARRFIRVFSVGLNLKYRQASFGNNSDGEWIFGGGNRQVQGNIKGYGLDLGVRGIIGKRFGVGLVLKDGLGKLDYSASNEVGTARGGSESLSPDLVLGLGYLGSRKFIVEIDLRKSLSADTEERVSMGIEKEFLTFLKLRGGISQNLSAGASNQQYAFGIGLDRQLNPRPIKFGLDAAYLINDIDNFYHIGFKIAWAPSGNSKPETNE